MGKFRTDDDYSPMDYEPDYSDDFPDYGDNDNPEIGDTPGGYGTIKKPNLFSMFFKSLGNVGSGIGSGVQNGLTLEKVFFVLYLIAMVFIIINIKAVLAFLFYTTMSVLQYIMGSLVVILLVYILFKYILRTR